MHAGPAVAAAAERSRLLAAFNGGFLLRSRAGGYELSGWTRDFIAVLAPPAGVAAPGGQPPVPLTELAQTVAEPPQPGQNGQSRACMAMKYEGS